MDDKKSSAEKMPPPPAPAPGSADEDEEMTKQDNLAIERAEEQKLRAKYAQVQRPSHAGAGGGGHSAFLQKRLAKGQKYFDSGDYQMAKQKTRVGGVVPPAMSGRSSMAVPVLAGMPTGDTIPTPDSVPARKSSIIQPIHDASRSMHVPSDPAHLGGGHNVGPTPLSPGPGQPIPNPAIAKLSSWIVKTWSKNENSTPHSVPIKNHLHFISTNWNEKNEKKKSLTESRF